MQEEAIAGKAFRRPTLYHRQLFDESLDGQLYVLKRMYAMMTLAHGQTVNKQISGRLRQHYKSTSPNQSSCKLFVSNSIKARQQEELFLQKVEELRVGVEDPKVLKTVSPLSASLCVHGVCILGVSASLHWFRCP